MPRPLSLRAVIALLAMSCAGAPVRRVGERRDGDPIWPRAGSLSVRYLGQLETAEDLGIEPSVWQRFTSWLSGEPVSSALTRPYALAVAVDGRVAVADPGGRLVRVYDPRRQRHQRLSEGLVSPVAVAFVGALLVVADSERHTLFAFDAEGAPAALPFALPPLGRPTGLAWDEPGQRLFVVDAANHCLQVLTAEGPRQLGQRGSQAGQFNFPTHVAWAAGQLYVTDSLNFRVQIFDGHLAYLRELGGLGDTPGDLPRPKGVAVDDRGTVWVVEGAFDAVQAFSDAGELVAVIGGSGTGPGRFWLPAGAAIDAGGRLYVADTWNARVQVFATAEAAP